MSDSYKLTYFKIKGLAEPIRMIFAVAGVAYEDVRIAQEEWPLVKEKFEYGQLPILEVDGKQLAQSNAICRFLAKKFDLNGAGDWEAAKIDELADVLVDFRGEWRKYFMEKDPVKKEELLGTLLGTTSPKYLGKVEAFKTANAGDFLVGDKLSWIDIQYAHFLEMFVKTSGPEVVGPYPNLKKLQDTVFAVPQIKEWIEKRPVTDM